MGRRESRKCKLFHKWNVFKSRRQESGRTIERTKLICRVCGEERIKEGVIPWFLD